MITTHEITILKNINLMFTLSGFVGQEKIISDIKRRIDFSKSNKQHFPNIILSGQQEMGKQTLAKAIANELDVVAKYVSAEKIEKISDLAMILTNLSPNNILIVDNISNFKKEVGKEFYQAIESGHLNIIIGKGKPSARELEIELPPFSVITTTSKVWQIDEKIRRWFVVYDFFSYSSENIKDIFIKLATEKGFIVSDEAARILSSYCNSSPGNVSVMIKRISSFLKAISSDLEIDNKNISEILAHLGFGENYPHSLNLVDKFAHMSGTDFEQWVADYFRRDGYEVRMTKTTGDHGIDLQLYESNKLVGAVQCKNWDGSVGEPTVRDFYGSLLSMKAPEGFIFATTSFTQQAKDFVHDKPIKLVDLEELIKLAENTI